MYILEMRTPGHILQILKCGERLIEAADKTQRVHSGLKCLPRVACLCSKMPMFLWAGTREGGEPFPLAFQYLTLMV